MTIGTEAREALSALLDGEARGDAAKFLARQVEHDPELAAQLGRWQVAGDLLRSARMAPQPMDLRSAIQHRLATEAAGAPRRALRAGNAWFGGLAMAAALGVVAIALRPGLEERSPTVAASVPAGTIATRQATPVAAAGDDRTAVVASRSDATPADVVEAPSATAFPVRPWRVPADADALIARAIAKPAGSTRTSAPAPERRVGSANPVRESVAIAAVPKAIKRSEDMERVLRGASEPPVLGVDPSSHPGWPRSVIPGSEGAFNASFSTGAQSSFGQRPPPDSKEP